MSIDWSEPDSEIQRLQTMVRLWSSLAAGLSAQCCTLADVLQQHAETTPEALRDALVPVVDATTKLCASARTLSERMPVVTPPAPPGSGAGLAG